ncbi:hypothetical protein BHM03_00005372 [Ensete ventricosum]|uniref:Uncharacterized protein n=1 Tax=Ensete ventricosum TaxID=4639 RepID=A0A445MB44_ENSVE|nr:hypothetical protein BHM03_00005372 [Ensete ventricosum]
MDEPLLPTSAPKTASPASTASYPSFLRRLRIFLVLAACALWANYEASKGFDITVLPGASRSPAALRFGLLFVSNGRAARLVLSSSDLVQRVLYPDDSFPRKPVRRITLFLADENLKETVVVSHGRRPGEFVVQMSPAVMEATDLQISVASALQRGVARVWLWDGRGQAPRSLLDAMVECLTTRNNAGATLSTTSCCAAADQLRLARVNRAMKEEWNDRMLEDVCGSPSEKVCSVFLTSYRPQYDHKQAS